mmetsp:Transcript_13644/g.40002  ORF Transcript_13644/g.40002 Transcript_13644/m.40002 type:complete len:288 (-) Transcript_13644:755-1618(-)
MTRLRRRFRAPPWQPPQRRKYLMTSATCRDPSPPRFVRLRRHFRPVQVRRVRPRAWASSTPPSSPSFMLRWRRLRPLAPSMLPSCRVCSLAPTRTRRDPCTGRWWQHSTRRLGRGRQLGRCSAPWGRWWAAPRAASASAGPGAEADQAPRPRRRAPLRRSPSDESWATGRGSGRSLRRTRRRGWAVLKSPSTSSSSPARRSSASRPPTSKRASASTPVAPTRRRAPTCSSTFSRRSCLTSRPAAWWRITSSRSACSTRRCCCSSSSSSSRPPSRTLTPTSPSPSCSA